MALMNIHYHVTANHLFNPKENPQISNNNQELNQLDYEQDFNENVEDMAEVICYWLMSLCSG